MARKTGSHSYTEEVVKTDKSSEQRRNTPQFSLRVVSNLDDFMRMQTVRSLVFMSDQACPYEEEFDGNDFAGLHILGEVDREPVGTLRLRFFADFAKLERVALRHEYRQSPFARKLIKFGLEICRRKGYRLVYGHAQVRLLRLWRTFGFSERAGRPRFVFSDHEYAEIVCPLAPHPDALTMDSDPLAIIRPEGSWDDPGILDHSIRRGATNPLREGK